MGTELDIGGHTSMVYRCLKCVTLKQFGNMKEKFNGLESVPGFEDLAKEDQDRVLQQEGLAGKASEDAAAAKQAEKEAKAAAKAEAKAKAKAEKAAAKAKAKMAAAEVKAEAEGDVSGPPNKRAKVS